MSHVTLYSSNPLIVVFSSYYSHEAAFFAAAGLLG